MRNPADQLEQLLAPVFDAAEVKNAPVIATGLPAGPGAASGQIYLNAERAVDAAARGEKVLLVRVETSPEDLRGMIAAEGILTARGGVSSHAGIRTRAARLDDVAAIEELITRSVRVLSAGYYDDAQIGSALRFLFGVDTQLIDDGTYHVIEQDGVLAAVGGWSRRRTLFGGDRWKQGVDDALDPSREPARIRAFFVHPAFARRGLGRSLFAACERDASAAGFRRLTLMATLPGEPLYRALGFAADERVELELPDGVRVPLVRMSRPIQD